VHYAFGSDLTAPKYGALIHIFANGLVTCLTHSYTNLSGWGLASRTMQLSIERNAIMTWEFRHIEGYVLGVCQMCFFPPDPDS